MPASQPKQSSWCPVNGLSILVLSSYAAIFFMLCRQQIDVRSPSTTMDMVATNSTSTSFKIDMDASSQYWRNDSFDAAEYLQSLSKQTLQNETLDKCRHIISVGHGMLNTTRTISERNLWSQAYQDWFLFHHFFYGKQNGIYLDVGANHPYELSNTAFFDVCMGWKGICVEASETLAARFEDTRSCTMATKCAWSSTEDNLKMLSDGRYGGLSRILSEQQYKQQKQQNDSQLFECSSISATDLLARYAAKNKFQETADLRWNVSASDSDDDVTKAIEIDFVSLDIEGAEQEFLGCFPFHKYDVKVWSIEINKPGTEESIDRILYHYGYLKFSYLPLWAYDLDAIYVKHDYMRPPYVRPNIWTGQYPKCETRRT